MPHNFSFVIDRKLCAMECPGSYDDLKADFSFLLNQGVRAIVSLTERALNSSELESAEFEWIHLPIRDFTPPSAEQMLTFSRKVEEWNKSGLPVMVHCGAGYGRTGTMLAAFLVWEGLSAAEAIKSIRQLRPMSVETIEQEYAVREFEIYIKGIDPR